MERAIEERIRRWREAIEEAREVAKCTSSTLGKTLVVLYGSYARGDFNEWSDLDLLVVTDRPLPKNPIERLSMVEACLRLSPRVEIVVLTVDEVRKLLAKGNPLVLEALESGIELWNTLGLSLEAIARS